MSGSWSISTFLRCKKSAGAACPTKMPCTCRTLRKTFAPTGCCFEPAALAKLIDDALRVFSAAPDILLHRPLQVARTWWEIRPFVDDVSATIRSTSPPSKANGAFNRCEPIELISKRPRCIHHCHSERFLVPYPLVGNRIPVSSSRCPCLRDPHSRRPLAVARWKLTHDTVG